MSNVTENFHLYKLPSPKIRHHRKNFFCMHRKFAEPIGKWLKRIENRINRCDFAKLTEYLLIDKFFSELDKQEMDAVQHKRQSWSLKQLRKYLCTDAVNAEPVCLFKE